MKRCVITGAAGGIGKALAHTFAEQGYHVVCVDLDAGALEQFRAETEGPEVHFTFLAADLADAAGRDDVLAALRDGPAIDVFIHNAGYNEIGNFADFSAARQRKIVAINLVAPMALTQALLAADMLATDGSLVYLSSLSAYVGYPGATVYAAAKQGLAAYARSLRVALRQQGVHVLTVFPGPTRTEMAAGCATFAGDDAAQRRMPPETVAAYIFAAVRARRRHSIPGIGNRIFALLGRIMPPMSAYAMRKLVLEQLPENRGE